jgi:chromosome segregation ATPase
MTDDVDNPGQVLGNIQRNVVEDNCVDQATVTMALVTSCQRLLEWQQLACDENAQLQEENDAAVEDLVKEHATEVEYLRGQRDGLREQADRHQQQIYQYLSHIKILENKYGSETAAVLNTLFGRITSLENTVTAEVERRMDLDKQLTLAETMRDEAKAALADAEKCNGTLTRHIRWIEGEHSDALARGARVEEERDQFRNRVHDLENLVQDIQGKGEGQDR